MEIDKKDTLAMKKSNKAAFIQELFDDDIYSTDTSLKPLVTEPDRKAEELGAFQTYLKEMKREEFY